MIPKFLGCDLSVPTYTWSVGVTSGYPVDNLKNYFPDSVSRSNATTDAQYLTIDFGTAVSCNYVILHGHNFETLGLPSNEVLLQTNTNDDTNWADASTVVTITADVDPIGYSFNAVSKRYWRLLFSKGSALSAKPEIGNLFLGTTLDFEKPHEFKHYTNMPSSVTSKMRSLDGRMRTAQTYGPIRRHRATFRLHSDAFVALWRTFLATVGNDALPYYYIDKDSGLYLVNLTSGFTPAESFRYNLNDIATLEMESTLADS